MEQTVTSSGSSRPAIIPVQLDSGGEVSRIDIEALEERASAQLAWQLEHAIRLPIRFRVPDLDVEGHAVEAPTDIVLDVIVGEDDVEGHAVRLRFASADDAAAFRRRVLAAGTFDGVLTSRPRGEWSSASPRVPSDLGSGRRLRGRRP